MNKNFILETIYENPLSSKEDVKEFRLEGDALITFPNQCLRMENKLSPDLEQKANYVFWCNQKFPENIMIEWEFKPIKEPGLAILFFAADGLDNTDLFDSSRNIRTGEYIQYHHGDINAFHVSYFRRKELDERIFHTCNLRKSYGFHLVTQGADPIPDAVECTDFYHLKVIKYNNLIQFFINDLLIFTFEDDASSFGPLLSGGYIGFRQLAPMIGEYRNLIVSSIRL